jgi:hypothetical protein
VEHITLLEMSLNKFAPKKAKRATMSLNIHIISTLDEKVTIAEPKALHQISPRTTVAAMKTLIEQDIGILPNMYVLTYIDACPLLEKSTMQDNFVVDGATFHLRPWKLWMDLLQHVFEGNSALCLRTMSITGPTEWNRYCAWVALYIASHCGHFVLVADLLSSTGALINTKSPCSWTPLHAAARMGHWKVLCILINNGADVRIKDNKGLTAFDLARKHGHKKCENSLNFSQWNLQKHQIVNERSNDYNAIKARRAAERQTHLSHDSTLKTWLCGTQCQLYMIKLSNPVSMKHIQEFDKIQKTNKPKKMVTIQQTSLDVPSFSSFKTTTTGNKSSTRQVFQLWMV